MDFPINESYWRDMSIEEKNEFIKQVFQHYRETGFPHYNLSVGEQVEEINKMKKKSRTIGVEKTSLKKHIKIFNKIIKD